MRMPFLFVCFFPTFKVLFPSGSCQSYVKDICYVNAWKKINFGQHRVEFILCHINLRLLHGTILRGFCPKKYGNLCINQQPVVIFMPILLEYPVIWAYFFIDPSNHGSSKPMVFMHSRLRSPYTRVIKNAMLVDTHTKLYCTEPILMIILAYACNRFVNIRLILDVRVHKRGCRTWMLLWKYNDKTKSEEHFFSLAHVMTCVYLVDKPYNQPLLILMHSTVRIWK